MSLFKDQLDINIRDITTFGGLVFYVVILVAVFTFNTQLALTLLYSLIFMVGVIVAIRSFYFKNRPKHIKYSTYLGRLHASSFPSLHTARAVYLGVFFAALTTSIFARIVLAILVLATLYSRIYLKKHDTIDLMGGILLGVLTFFVF